MTFAASLLALALAPAWGPDETRLCEAKLIDRGREIAFARIEVDRDHAVVDTFLYYRERDYGARWSVLGGDFARFRTLTGISLDALTLPHDAGFPVTVAFLIDGREVARSSFAEPTTWIVHTPLSPAPASAGPPRDKSFYPGVQIEVQAGAVDDLYGAARAELIATSAAGKTIGHFVLPLPDWEKLAQTARTAFEQLEAQRMQRKCTIPPFIIVTGDHGTRVR